VTVNARPQAAITSAALSMCSGTSAQITGTVNASGPWTIQLNNNGGTVTGNGSGTWTKSVSPTATTTYSMISLADALCTSAASDITGSAQVTVVPNVTPAVSISAGATTVCEGNAVLFTATPVNGGATPSYQWRVNGVNTGLNSATFATASLVNGDQVTCVMTSAITCVTAPAVTSNTVNMTVVPMPTLADAGLDRAMCYTAGSSINLAGNTPLIGTGAWSISVGPKRANSQFSVLSNPTATFTPQAAGTYTLLWTISNGSTCPVSSDEVIITVNNPPFIRYFSREYSDFRYRYMVGLQRTFCFRFSIQQHCC
jgi:hypothetical protein